MKTEKQVAKLLDEYRNAVRDIEVFHKDAFYSKERRLRAELLALLATTLKEAEAVGELFSDSHGVHHILFYTQEDGMTPLVDVKDGDKFYLAPQALVVGAVARLFVHPADLIEGDFHFEDLEPLVDLDRGEYDLYLSGEKSKR